VTDQAGVQYWFGRRQGRFPGDTLDTNSAQVVPVYAHKPGDPCYTSSTSMQANRCWQVYRWNLEYVVDPRGNSMTYIYSPYNGSYGGMLGSHGGAVYTIAADLDRVEYGTRAGQEGTGNAPATVVFQRTGRCTDETGATCAGQYQNWPDTPWDLYCDPNATTCNDYSPSFWTPHKLSGIQTQVWDTGTGAYINAGRYELTYAYPSTGDHVAPAGDDTTPSLWLQSITPVGIAMGPGIAGGQVNGATLSFGGNINPNRVAWGANANGAPPLMHYRITAIANGAGGRTEVGYLGDSGCTAQSAAWPTTESNQRRCWPQWYEGGFVWFHKYVVANVYVKDLTGGGPDQTWTYEYSGTGSTTAALWRYDTNPVVPASRRTWSDWRGYPTVTTYHGPPGGAQTVTRDLYYRGMNGDRNEGMGWRAVDIVDSQGNAGIDHHALGGVLREHTILNGPSTVVSSTIHEPWVINHYANYPDYADMHDTRTVRTRTWIAATNTWRWTKATTDYDINALPTQTVDYGDEATTSDDTCTRFYYAQNNSGHLINYPSRIVTFSGTGCATGDTRLGEARVFYDGTVLLGEAPTRGLPTKTQALVSTGPDVWATTEAGYDPQGRPTSTKDARGRTSTVAYTPAAGGPLRQTTATNPLGHTTSTMVNPGLGVPVTVTDANGKTTTIEYDTLGRLTKAWQPGHPTSGTPDLEHAYLLRTTGANAVTTKRLGPNGNQIVSHDLYDGQFRLRQHQEPAAQAVGGRMIIDTGYDQRGLAVKVSTLHNGSPPDTTLVGFADTDIKLQTRYTYDLVGRVTADQYWSLDALKWQTATGYDGDRSMVTPPAGGIPTTALVDGKGRTTELRQHTGGTTTSPYQTTTYAYDRLDRLIQVTDPAGNLWTTTYDIAGRTTATTDPDKGGTSFTYNAAGDLLTSTDARGTTLSYNYDHLGRKTELWQGAVGTGTKRASWHYDTLADGTSVKGHAFKSTRWHNGEAYSSETVSVDDAYRPLSSKVSLPASMGTLAGPWTTSTTYKPDGQTATQTMPAAGSLPAETITYGYDDAGRPLTMTGLDTYIANTTYNVRGNLVGRTLGTGTKRIQLDTIFDIHTNRLAETRVSTESQTAPNTWVPQLIEQYGYDNAGNVKNIKEVTEVSGFATTVSNQCFGYDGLRRLTEAWSTTAARCQSTPSQAVVGGPDPYWTSYQYNSIGNRTSDTVHTPGGNTVRTYTYPSSGTTAVRPHAITSVSAAGPNPGTDSYAYDNAGNTTTRNIAGRPGQTLTWDPEGHLDSVTDSGGTTSYVYTADGQRLLAYEPGSVTILYLGGIELRRTTTGISCTRHYGVAARTTGGGLTWIAADHHGTGQVAINPTTLAVTRRKSDPFGNARGPAATWPTTRGFVNGVQDPTGLIHLGAREYEPAAGRFISVDPIMDLTDPIQWNGYTYASSNPTTNADPDGLINRSCLEACGSKEDKEEQARLQAGKFNDAQEAENKGDYNAKHDNARDMAAWEIRAMCPTCKIYIEYPSEMRPAKTRTTRATPT
jgi:RHS repeat-associated protein